MEPMEELVRAFEEKLAAVRSMIDQYDETMDYASHCTLQGFAEGIAFAIEEATDRLQARKKRGKSRLK